MSNISSFKDFVSESIYLAPETSQPFPAHLELPSQDDPSRLSTGLVQARVVELVYWRLQHTELY